MGIVDLPKAGVACCIYYTYLTTDTWGWKPTL